MFFCAGPPSRFQRNPWATDGFPEGMNNVAIGLFFFKGLTGNPDHYHYYYSTTPTPTLTITTITPNYCYFNAIVSATARATARATACAPNYCYFSAVVNATARAAALNWGLVVMYGLICYFFGSMSSSAIGVIIIIVGVGIIRRW